MKLYGTSAGAMAQCVRRAIVAAYAKRVVWTRKPKFIQKRFWFMEFDFEAVARFLIALTTVISLLLTAVELIYLKIKKMFR